MSYEPIKEDWTSEDYLNYSDFYRFCSKIEEVQEYARELGYQVNYPVPSYSPAGFPLYASEFNMIEEAVYGINGKTYNLKLGMQKEWLPNRPTPTFEDLNRLGNAINTLAGYLQAEKIGAHRLRIVLGRKENF